jgi:alpha-galactosidase-like protein
MTATIAAPSAPAQAPDGTWTWYLHKMAGPSGDGTYLDFLPPEGETDQTATDTAAVAGDPLVIASSMEAPLAGPLPMSTEPGEALVWIKSWNNLPAPGTKVTVEILSGEAIVAAGSLTQDVLLGAIVEFKVPLSVSSSELTGGALVSWKVTIEAEECGCNNPAAYPRGVSPDHAWRFTLPVTGSLPSLGGPEILLSAASPNVSVVAGANVTASINVTNKGTANATVVLAVSSLPDGFNASFASYNATLEPGTSMEVPINISVPIGAPLGPQNLTILLVNANVTLNLTIAVVAAPDVDSPPAGNATTGAADLEAAANAGTPSVSFVIGLAAALGVMAARRTKRNP